jgi:hypothetical protein
VNTRKHNDGNERQADIGVLISKKLSALLERVMAERNISGRASYWRSVGLGLPEIRVLSPSHMLQVIDEYLSKYSDNRDKFVIVYLHLGNFMKLRTLDIEELIRRASLKLGDAEIHELSRYEVNNPHISLIDSISTALIYVGVDYVSRQLSALNYIYFTYFINNEPLPFHLIALYLNHPARRFVRINKEVDDAARAVFKAVTFSLGFLVPFTEKGDDMFLSIVPSRCGTMAIWTIPSDNRFGVIRVPSCIRGYEDLFHKNVQLFDYDAPGIGIYRDLGMWRLMLRENSVK